MWFPNPELRLWPGINMAQPFHREAFSSTLPISCKCQPLPWVLSLSTAEDIEVWLPVLGWEDFYEISSFGRVKRLAWSDQRGHKGGTRNFPEKIIKGRPNRWHYCRVDLCKNGEKPKHHFIHVMVLTAFRAPRPPGHETRHLDGNRGNNRLDNLAWGTRADQFDDMRSHGTFQQGEMRPWTKLTEKEVLEIRELTALGAMRQEDIAIKYGITRQNVSKIHRRTRWRHLD